MAVTITRSVWIDDDGSGSVGTVINQALHTSLYNEIDTALAKVAQLAGGNTFSGGQTLSTSLAVGTAPGFQVTTGGFVTVNAAPGSVNARVGIAMDGAVTNGIAIQNTSSGNAGLFMFFNNSAGAGAGSISHTGATTVSYGTSSDARLKDDDGAATDVSALRGVVVHDFRWKVDGRRARGVFAQEAHAVFPAAIAAGTDETTPDGTLARPWMTDYSKFVPDLIVGWQQHDAALRELRAALGLR